MEAKERPLTARGAEKALALSAGTIHYHERGRGRPIVFVHGLAVNGDLWRQVVPALSGQFRCITPDLPLGCHRPAMHADAELSPGAVAALVAELIDKLELDDVILVGNDTGGAICQLVVTRHPARIGALVLTPCDAYENFLPPLFRPMQLLARVPVLLKAALQPLRIRALRRLPMAFGLLSRRPIPHEISDAYVSRLLSEPGVFRDTAKFLRKIDSRETIAAANRFGEFDKPVLLVWASDERLFPRAHAERMKAAFPNARLAVIDDSRTFVSEDRPDDLVREILAFAGADAKSSRAA